MFLFACVCIVGLWWGCNWIHKKKASYVWNSKVSSFLWIDKDNFNYSWIIILAKRHKWKWLYSNFRPHTHTHDICCCCCYVWRCLARKWHKTHAGKKKCKPIRSINVGLTNINYSNCYYMLRMMMHSRLNPFFSTTTTTERKK